MSDRETKLPDPEVADGRKKFVYWKFGLCILGGFVLGFILGGPLGALVLSLLGYFLPLRFVTGKWRPGRVGTNVLGFVIVIPVALLLIGFLFDLIGIW
tara:strand:- start:134 stop:427 length:294 start_codon:yes stop_codon:yes gene_type:complete